MNGTEQSEMQLLKREQCASDDGRCPCCHCVCERCTHTGEGGCCEFECNNPGRRP